MRIGTILHTSHVKTRMYIRYEDHAETLDANTTKFEDGLDGLESKLESQAHTAPIPKCP